MDQDEKKSMHLEHVWKSAPTLTWFTKIRHELRLIHNKNNYKDNSSDGYISVHTNKQ